MIYFAWYMLRVVFILFFLLPVCILASDKIKWKQTASGIYYKIYKTDTGKLKPVYGDHIWMHLRKYGPNKKEIFNTRIFDIQNGVEMDYKKPNRKADVTEIFSLMGIGDSAYVKIPSNLIDSNETDNRFYTFKLNLLNFKRKDAYLDEKNEHYDQQVILDSFSIVDYIRNNDLHDCKPDEFGNWYMRKEMGTGRPVKENDTVTINYIGRLTNGKQFDNSFDRKQPFSFVVGKKQVIDGLEKGILNFFYGDKGILLIPGRSGYGDKEVGKIPPNSVLIFEFEFLK